MQYSSLMRSKHWWNMTYMCWIHGETTLVRFHMNLSWRRGIKKRRRDLTVHINSWGHRQRCVSHNLGINKCDWWWLATGRVTEMKVEVKLTRARWRCSKTKWGGGGEGKRAEEAQEPDGATGTRWRVRDSEERLGGNKKYKKDSVLELVRLEWKVINGC